LKNMTGIDSPYEAPEHPTAVIDCGATTVEAGVGLLLNLLDRSSK
jgi:adenylylsulfate kinase-like enzyme